MSQLHHTVMVLSSLEIWYHWEILSIVVYLIDVADVSRSARYRLEMFHWQKILQRERLNNGFFKYFR